MTTVRSRDDILAPTADFSPKVRTHRGMGLGMAVLSAATFGTSGTFGDGLLRSGWTPGAAVLARILVAAALLTPFALVQLHGRWHTLRRQAGLLLEYLGAVLVIGWLWLRRGQRPRRLTIAGAIAAIAGLVLMIGVTGTGGISAVG